MEKKEDVIAGEPIIIGETTLLPIIRTVVICQSGRNGITGFAGKDIVGVVVISPAEQRAINVLGEEVPVTDYVARVPEVAELLRGS